MAVSLDRFGGAVPSDPSISYETKQALMYLVDDLDRMETDVRAARLWMVELGIDGEKLAGQAEEALHDLQGVVKRYVDGAVVD